MNQNKSKLLRRMAAVAATAQGGSVEEVERSFRQQYAALKRGWTRTPHTMKRGVVNLSQWHEAKARAFAQ